MIFNEHSKLANTHAFLSPSTPHWLRYDDDKLVRRFTTAMAAELGTRLHAYAAEAIALRIRQLDNGSTLSTYINDAIGYRMTPEQVLFYSYNCYGTADTLSYRRKFLRVHDLKTGQSRCSTDQLKTYCAIFCLEYRVDPLDTEFETRIYQNDDIKVENPDGDEILHIMDRIRHADKIVDELRQESMA